MWTEPILHVDMDSFFVEVERLDNPSLVGRPVAVGGVGPRGVIASASYEARDYGVRSAQPTSTAMRLCPSLEVVPPSHRKYGESSVEVFSVFRSVTPLVEGLSVDEAFLDVSGLTRHFDNPVAVGEHVRNQLMEEIGLPSSVGVAATKLVAKLASESAKPNGIRHVPKESQAEFLHALPASALWGVGPATLASLEELGVQTIGDIAEMPESAIKAKTGRVVGQRLIELSRGMDARRVEPDSAAQSISVEQTYDTDLVGTDLIETAVLAHSQKLSMRLRRAGVGARTVGVKIRFADFTTLTRSNTLTEAATSARDLYRVAVGLLDGIDVDRPVRLLGLSGSSFESAKAPRQLDLGSSEERSQLDEVIAQVQERFGDGAVEPARLARAPKREQVVAEDD